MVRDHRADGLFVPKVDATDLANVRLCEHVVLSCCFVSLSAEL